MSGLISNTLVDKLLPKAQPYEVRDSALKGFMVRVNKSGVKSYVVQYGRGKRYTIGSTEVISAKEAREKAKTILGDKAKGLDPQAIKAKTKSQKTLQQFFEEDYIPWAMSHYKSGENAIGRVRFHFGSLFNKPLHEVKMQDIEKWRTQALETLKPNSVNKTASCLRSVFTKAVEWELIAEHPFKNLKAIKYGDTRVRYLSESEEKALMKALSEREAKVKQLRKNGNKWREQRGYELLPDRDQDNYVDHLFPMVIIALNTGLRRGELTSLERQHVSLAQRHIFVPDTKNGTSRSVPLNKAAHAALSKWLRQTEHIESPYVLPGKNPANHIQDVKKGWTTVRAEAKLKNFHWHDMRHDFASKLVMAGVDLYTVSKLLGHQSVEQTMKYAHLAPDYIASSVGKLDERRTNS